MACCKFGYFEVGDELVVTVCNATGTGCGHEMGDVILNVCYQGHKVNSAGVLCACLNVITEHYCPICGCRTLCVYVPCSSDVLSIDIQAIEDELNQMLNSI